MMPEKPQAIWSVTQQAFRPLILQFCPNSSVLEEGQEKTAGSQTNWNKICRFFLYRIQVMVETQLCHFLVEAYTCWAKFLLV